LHEAIGIGEEAVFVGHDAQTRAGGEKFTAGEEKVGPGRAGRPSRCRPRKFRKAGRRPRPSAAVSVASSGRHR
jgi:hypothetical protein